METVRSQVYLETSQQRRLKDLAHERSLTISALLREIVEDYLCGNRPRKKFTRQDYQALVALGYSEDGQRQVRVAENHDEYISDAIAERKIRKKKS